MDLQSIESEAVNELESTKSLDEINALYTKYLGRKEGHLTKILRNLGTLTPEEKKKIGQAANQLRSLLEEKISTKKSNFQESSLTQKIQTEKIDGSAPGQLFQRGTPHPILQTIREIGAIFKGLGFEAVEGPEVETDFNNFTALNIPENHPARDLHDTFYLNKEETDAKGRKRPYLLRTHTSPVQIRLMKAVKPPVRIIAPGRVYRHEAIDATHAAVFHQIEGLVIDKHITFADLKGTLTYFSEKYFGKGVRVRFRPSYFPFVEPGAEMDIEFKVKNQETGEINTRWLEMLGAGMVHPDVLKNVGYDSKKYTGFAFGMGIERIVMTRSKIRDIRYFLESDLRFLEQFRW